MLEKSLDSISKDDVDQFIEEKFREDRVLEYKEELPDNKPSSKKEFLADISSFANAAGGHILYGIEDDRDDQGNATGIPKVASGLKIKNVDKEIGRLENLSRDGLDPQIPGLQFYPIDGFQNGPILIARIPVSWIAPHLVKYEKDYRFYTRSSNGKYRMDRANIKSAFLGAEESAAKIVQFRNGRLSKIIAEETPVSLAPGPILVLHIIPFAMEERISSFDLSALHMQGNQFPPIFWDKWFPTSVKTRFNPDGVFSFYLSDGKNNQQALGYVQLFRHGALEAADTDVASDSAKKIWGVDLEAELIKKLALYLDLLKNQNILPPFSIMLSLLNAKGFKIVKRDERDRQIVQYDKIDRNTITLPEVVMETANKKPDQILQPIFHAFWQASGWPRSYSYNEKGERVI